MTRPKSEDPKLPITLRLATSVLAQWQAGGEDWRQRMEATLAAAVGDSVPISPKRVLEAAERRLGVEPVKLVTTPQGSAPLAAVRRAAAPSSAERVSMSKAMEESGIQVGRSIYKPGALLKGPKTTKGRRG